MPFPVSAPSLAMPRARNLEVAAGVNLLVMGVIGAGMLVALVLPPGPFTHGPGFLGQFVTLDGGFYRDISWHGYVWNPAVGGVFGHGGTMAFFPLFPLVIRGLGVLAGTSSPLVGLAAGLGIGLWSNMMFARLAGAVLAPEAARRAAVLFALWPATCFLLMGYPVSLINLCAAACLWHFVEGRRNWALFWAGLGTGAAPNVVFIAAALWLVLVWEVFRGTVTARAVSRLLAQGAASVWGLLAFMVFQAVRFGDPFAFLAAQRGFTQTPALPAHVLRVINPAWYLFPLTFTAQRFAGAPAPGHEAAFRQTCAVAWQLDIDLAALVLAVWGLLIAMRRCEHKVLPLSGFFLALGYVWFVGTGTFNLLCGVRMLYPALAVFLMLGAVTAGRPGVFGGLAIFFAAAGAVSVALIGAGYGII